MFNALPSKITKSENPSTNRPLSVVYEILTCKVKCLKGSVEERVGCQHQEKLLHIHPKDPKKKKKKSPASMMSSLGKREHIREEVNPRKKCLAFSPHLLNKIVR